MIGKSSDVGGGLAQAGSRTLGFDEKFVHLLPQAQLFCCRCVLDPFAWRAYCVFRASGLHAAFQRGGNSPEQPRSRSDGPAVYG